MISQMKRDIKYEIFDYACSYWHPNITNENIQYAQQKLHDFAPASKVEPILGEKDIKTKG